MPAIPAISDFNDAAVTEGEYKTAFEGLHNYLTGMLGTAGTQAAALSALGSFVGAGVTVKTGNYTVVAADRGKIISCTNSFTLSLTAAATLGAGFAVVVANVGAGTITIDPNASELIDGAATYSLRAGTSVALMCSGSSWIKLGTPPLLQQTEVQTFDSSGTWTKPSFGSLARIQVWGAGGGGARDSFGNGSGGGGGGYFEITVPLATLGATEVVTIGAGGTGRTASAGDGTDGGSSSFGSLASAAGGGGGKRTENYGAPGGPVTTGTPTWPWFSAPVMTAAGETYDPNTTSTLQVASAAQSPFHGGIGIRTLPSTSPLPAYFPYNHAIYGGGGGGPTGGISLYGGNGGNSGVVGTAPGGGGGGATGTSTNGADGAAGRVVVTVW